MKNEDKIESNRDSYFTAVSNSYFTDDFEKKLSLLNITKNKKQNHLKEDNFKASIFMFIGYFLYSIVNLLGKIIGFYFPLVENSTTNLIRGFILMILCHMYFHMKKIDYISQLNKPKKKLFFLFIRCFTGALSNFILFESLKHMRISSTITIVHTSPIFVSILSFIFLKSKFTILDLITFIICFFSICLITKPSILLTGNQDDGDTPYGLFLSVNCSILSAIAIFTNKVISKDFDHLISIYGMGICYILQSAFILPFTEYGFSTLNFTCVLISIILSIIFFYCLVFIVISLNIGNPIKILPITYIGIVINQFYNSLIFHQFSDVYDYIGCFFIIVINILKTVIQKE